MTDCITGAGTFPTNTQLRINGKFKDINQAPADPTSGTITITNPVGAVTTIPFGSWVRDSLSRWHVLYTTGALVGTYTIDWLCSTGVIVERKAYFLVA